jgi:hypothetical protein
MANNPTKAQQKKFVKGVKAGLLEMGAVMLPESKYRKEITEFELETIVGKLTITLRDDQSFLFMVFSRFENVDKAKHKFNCNQYSGKYNFSQTLRHTTVEQSIEFALMHFECALPKELA